MSEETTTPTTEAENKVAERTFTQEELDRIVKERLEREKGNTAKKYADYDELKAKAAKLAELEQAQMSELEKAKIAAETAKAQVEALEAEKKALQIAHLKTTLCAKAGLPAGFESRVKGEDEATIAADIEALKAILPKGSAGGAGAPSGSAGASPTTEQRYMEAMKAGDIVLAMQLKTQLYNERK